jgi:hypothetical protein
MLPHNEVRNKKVYTQRRGVSQAANKRNSYPDGGLRETEEHNFENRLNKYR